MKLNSLVLLAGFSSRMGQSKQHVVLKEFTFLETILQKIEANRKVLHKMLFVGQVDDERSQNLIMSHGGIWINNLSPEDGPLSSIRLAVQSENDSAILLWPIDHPMVKVETVEKLIKIWESNPSLITVPSDGLHRGHPSIFPQWCCREFFKVDLASGARKILLNHPERISHVLCDDLWILKNLNNQEALKEARNIMAKD